MEDRHGRRSTLITSQLPVSQWYEVLQEPTVADAILDRLVHTAHRIELQGESMRKKPKPTRRGEKKKTNHNHYFASLLIAHYHHLVRGVTISGFRGSASRFCAILRETGIFLPMAAFRFDGCNLTISLEGCCGPSKFQPSSQPNKFKYVHHRFCGSLPEVWPSVRQNP